MAKININFNNADYSIDESALTDATNDLKSHLSTTMAGTGATINLGGVAYNIDSTKLTIATNNFVSHLGTISGSGSKVVVGGVEYSVDSNKVAGAVAELEAVLGGLNSPDTPTEEERLEGDGAEFYTLAPTALSFRSTAPLNELQEVQINGITVDPANYTLEEGSTIVTFPIDYLKTLNVGSYEVAVASDSKTVKGDFSVKAPDLNENGFYYNQPYTAYVDMFGENESFFIREDGIMDIVGTPSGDISQCTYTCSGNQMTVISPVIGTLTATVSDDGTEIFCNELQISFVLGTESLVSDEDYIYFYKEELGGYEVRPIDMTKSSYASIRTGINGYNTVKIADYAFCLGGTDQGNTNLEVAPEIPNTVTTIGASAFRHCNALESIKLPKSLTSFGTDAFFGCNALISIVFEGTVEQWDAIAKYNRWYDDVPATHVHCTDGDVAL